MNDESEPFQELLRYAIERVAVGPDRGRDLSRDEAHQLGQALLDPQVDPVRAAVVLIGLRMKRESMPELSGLLQALLLEFAPHPVKVDELLCLAEPFDGYLRHNPVSAFLPAVLATLGLPTLMHGVQSVGPKHGVTPHQVYRLAGIEPLASLEAGAEQLESHGWAYVDQAIYAPRLHALTELRERMVKRTALTTLERVLMPLQARVKTHLAIGYVHRAYPELYASLARQAGFAGVLLTKGVEGGLLPALHKPLRSQYLQPDSSVPDDLELQCPIALSERAALPRFDGMTGQAAAQECLDQGHAVLRGASGIARDTLCLAAGQILFAYGCADSLSAAVVKVQNCLDNGSANARFAAVFS